MDPSPPPAPPVPLHGGLHKGLGDVLHVIDDRGFQMYVAVDEKDALRSSLCAADPEARKYAQRVPSPFRALFFPTSRAVSPTLVEPPAKGRPRSSVPSRCRHCWCADVVVLLGEDLLDFHHVEHCLAYVGVSAPLNLFSVGKKIPGTGIRTHVQTRQKVTNQMSYREKKERK